MQAQELGERDSSLACRAAELESTETKLSGDRTQAQLLLQELDSRVAAVEAQEQELQSRVASASQQGQEMQQREAELQEREEQLNQQEAELQVRLVLLLHHCLLCSVVCFAAWGAACWPQLMMSCQLCWASIDKVREVSTLCATFSCGSSLSRMTSAFNQLQVLTACPAVRWWTEE